MRTLVVKSFLLTLIICSVTSNLFAQKEGNIWFFGDSAAVDFNSGVPIALVGSNMHTYEGCATACDENGKLLFYSNGEKIWNRNHVVMPNGVELGGNHSSTQSVLIVKKPYSKNIFYVFTTIDKGEQNGLRYSILDMSLQNGQGDVTSSKSISMQTPVCEKLTAIKHSNGRSFWIITHGFHSDEFFSYLLDSTGLDLNPVISKIGPIITGEYFNSFGYLKCSPNGEYLAMANNYTQTADLFKFSTSSGQVSQFLTTLDTFYNGSRIFPYGIEFSTNSRYLYVSDRDGPASHAVYQFDLGLQQIDLIRASSIEIAQNIGGAIQLGPDGKIYVARPQTHYLAVINRPNERGGLCGYQEDGVFLGTGKPLLGLPSYPNTIYNIKIESLNTCLNDTTTFIAHYALDPDSVLWNFDDIESGSNTSTLDSSIHTFSDTGTFNVKLIVYRGGSIDTVSHLVKIHEPPLAYIGGDTTMCFGEQLILQPQPLENYIWQDGTMAPSLIASQSGSYSIRLHGCNQVLSEINLAFKDCSCKLYFPNAFSPNDRPPNEVFKPTGSCLVTEYRLSIYNRWGELLFQTEDIESGWDGKYSGKDVQSGGYLWLSQYSVSLEDGRKRRLYDNGIITIVR
ncbi:MAG: gliding motility-associated C-terminal domain-containing protein [Flavobacteriales bacterium]|nr:gliding motility-associated C-terminal domain-containing protein [Flavobacteriales bacterium]